MQPTFFFDIDGCFHPHGTARFNDNNLVHRAPDDGLFVWCDPLVSLLRAFPDMPLVCHSTWRNLYDLDGLRQQLPDAIAHRTLATTEPYRDRHLSILDYAAANKITHYVILDDDLWAFPTGLEQLIWLPDNKGLSTPSAQDKMALAVVKMHQSWAAERANA